MDCSWAHYAQTDQWFAAWSANARRASYIIVFFTPEYRARFTEALWMEAQLIYELYQGGVHVYIFDSETMKAAEIRANLTDRVTMMGSFSEWWAFCSANQPRSEARATGVADNKVGARVPPPFRFRSTLERHSLPPMPSSSPPPSLSTLTDGIRGEQVVGHRRHRRDGSRQRK